MCRIIHHISLTRLLSWGHRFTLCDGNFMIDFATTRTNDTILPRSRSFLAGL